MPRLTDSVPKYRKHRASGQAIVTLSGRDHYLGPHGTKTSKAEYDRLIAEWLANGRSPVTSDSDSKDELTVTELIAGYVRHLKSTYPNFSSPRSEPTRILVVLKIVKAMYGRTPARNFGPLSLKAVRQRLIERDQSRKFVNENVRRVVRLFRWGVENEWVDPNVLRALQAVEGLRKGRCNVREGNTVKPVPLADVEKTLPFLPAVLADVARLQFLSGSRPSEILGLKPCMIDRSSGDVWTCRLDEHKTANAGKSRTIFFGPQAIAILRPYLLRPADQFCFRPEESEQRRMEAAHARRRTPLDTGNRPGLRRPSKADGGRRTGKRRDFREFYTSHRFYVAVVRAAAKAGVPKWTPYQLRHSRATDLRRLYGLESAQAVLGHSELRTTQVYAAQNEGRAREIARKVG